MARSLTAEQLATIERHYRTHTHQQIADMIGRSRHCVRNACSKNGWTTRDDAWTDSELQQLIAWYARPGCRGKDTLNLQQLADSVGRCKANVCRKARALGLTSLTRKIDKEQTRLALSERSKQQIAERGHPRGALGMKHGEETKRRISEKSRKAWDQMRGRPLLIADRAARTAQTNLQRYGTACPLQAKNNGANVYSRCKRGVREDLGFFVRSRWEANYARYLKWLEQRGDIAAWEYEPITFRFEGVSRGPYTYMPDFKVIEKNGSVAYHEVKGWMDSGSRSRLKRFAKFYPSHTLLVIDAKAYRQIEQKLSSVIPHWERG